MDPGLALLSLGIDALLYETQHTIIHIFLAARLSITRKWKTPFPPILTEVLDLTQVHCSYEQMMASCSGRLHCSLLKWSPWNSWFLKSL